MNVKIFSMAFEGKSANILVLLKSLQKLPPSCNVSTFLEGTAACNTQLTAKFVCHFISYFSVDNQIKEVLLHDKTELPCF